MKDTLGIITTNYSAKTPSVLTEARPLASLPYLGRYRLVDFPLSNMVNADIRTIGLVLPSNYRSVLDHVGSGKDFRLSRKGGGLFVMPGSAFGTSRTGSRFLLRDFAANRVIFERSNADNVLFAAANFVYNMDYNLLHDAFVESGADAMVLTRTSDEDNADVMGFELDGDKVRGVKHGVAYGDTAFMDCFIIRRAAFLEMLDWYATVDYLDLFDALEEDYARLDIRVYRYNDYAAAVFDEQSYFRHNMELLDPENVAQLFPEGREIMTKAHDNPPVRYGADAHVENSLLCGACRIEGAVIGSILGRGVVVESGANVVNSVIMQNCVIKKGARVENAILDRYNVVPAGTEMRGTSSRVLVRGKAKMG